jgi:K+-transporting ATPase KdpF subunit
MTLAALGKPLRSKHDGPNLHRCRARILRGIGCVPAEGESAMTPLYLAGGLLAAALLIYLFVALLKPEIFS